MRAVSKLAPWSVRALSILLPVLARNRLVAHGVFDHRIVSLLAFTTRSTNLGRALITRTGAIVCMVRLVLDVEGTSGLERDRLLAWRLGGMSHAMHRRVREVELLDTARFLSFRHGCPLLEFEDPKQRIQVRDESKFSTAASRRVHN